MKIISVKKFIFLVYLILFIILFIFVPGDPGHCGRAFQAEGGKLSSHESHQQYSSPPPVAAAASQLRQNLSASSIHTYT